MIQQHKVDLDEVQLHYVEAPGPGPALLFVHGSTGSHTAFVPFLSTLTQHAHVYALDLRGHGLSGRTPGKYQLPDYGRDVAAFLQTVVCESAFVAGHSLGGLIAVWLAAHHPESVRGIFLEDPPLYMTQLPRFQKTGFYHYFLQLRAHLPKHHVHGGTLAAMVEYVNQMPITPEGQTLLDLAGSKKVQERAIELHHLDPATLEPLVEGILMGSHESDELLAKVRCPVRLLVGQFEAGGAMEAQDVTRAVARLAHCDDTVFAGVGHMIHQDRPDEYVGTLLEFVAKV